MQPDAAFPAVRHVETVPDDEGVALLPRAIAHRVAGTLLGTAGGYLAAYLVDRIELVVVRRSQGVEVAQIPSGASSHAVAIMLPRIAPPVRR